ncbi:peptidoglycan-binding domain-containing protein [Bradyrhizobium sp.]
MPRRRRGATAVAIEASDDRSLAMRILLHSPKDLIAGALAFAAVSAIVANATFMQAGHHPSPMFGTTVSAPVAAANPLPRPRLRPVEATLKPADVKLAEARPTEVRPVDVKPAAPVSIIAKTNPAPVASATPARPPAPIPVSSRSDPVGDLIIASRRVAAVQRALTDYGYGQLKPTGTVGSDTLAAIQKFERDRKLPITGQMSDRLVRELSAATGRAID